MKKILITAGIIMMASTVVFARNNIESNDRKEVKTGRREVKKKLRRDRRAKNNNLVSYFTKARFAWDFPGATSVEFIKINNFDEVDFISEKRMLKAYYDYSNNLVGTTEKIAFEDLPENAQKEIRHTYAGYTVADAIKFDDNENNETDMILYGIPLGDEDNYFVELQNAGKAIVVRVDLSGYVYFFANMN